MGVHVVDLNAFDVVEMSAGKVSTAIESVFEECVHFAPCIILLRKVHAFSQMPSHMEVVDSLSKCLNDCIAQGNANRSGEAAGGLGGGRGEGRAFQPRGQSDAKGNVILVSTCDSVPDMKAVLRNCFSHEIEVRLPTSGARDAVLRRFCAEGKVEGMVAETVGLSFRDIHAVIAEAEAQRLHSPPDSPSSSPAAAAAADSTSFEEGVDAVLKDVRNRISTSLGAPKVPSVTWNDVGGLSDAKDNIVSIIEMPLKYPNLFSKGVRKKSGILLYGPPGTGKTLLAKAIATEFHMNFLSVKGPELINMYVGESERNVREVFERARNASPCIVFFDELDSLAPARGNGGDSGGVMDRVVSQFLAELDGVQTSSGETIFVVGATNRPDLIDSALLRPGRFDCLQYIGIASSKADKGNVMNALTRKFALGDDVVMDELGGLCPTNFSGADLYALCTDAWLNAAKDLMGGAEEGGTSDVPVVVSREHFVKALEGIRPSISDAELRHYESLQKTFLKSRAT